MKKSNLIFIVFVLLISSPAVIYLLIPGFFLSDDGNSMVIRFSAFYEALRSGQVPVRFLARLNFGYGYPVSDFLYPLFMYIGVPIHAIGFSFVNSIKIILGLSFISGSLFSFLWLRKLFDRESSFVGSIVYSFFPYHLTDMYSRGSVGEVLALGIIPFVLWQIERRSLLWGSIGIFLLTLSHNTLAVLFIIFIALYAILDIYVSKNKKISGWFYASILGLGLGLSSFFSIPAIFDLQYTVFTKTSVSDWTKYFAELNQIGISTFAILLIILTFILFKKIVIRKHRLTILILSIGLVSIFLATPPSSFLWKVLPVSFIQFPFRFLSLTILTTSFLAACLTSVLVGRNKTAMVVLLLVLVIFSSKDFLSPKVFQNYPDTFYSTNQDSTTVRNEYMPKWVQQIPDKMPDKKIEVVKGKSEINNLESRGTKIKFNLDSKEESLIKVNEIYFPGWEVSVDGIKSPIFYNNKYGIIHFGVGRGSHTVEVKFGETNLRLLADAISIISILLLFLISKKHVKYS